MAIIRITITLSIINASTLVITEGSSPYCDVSISVLNFGVNGPMSVICVLKLGTLENGLINAIIISVGIHVIINVSKSASISVSAELPISSVKNAYGPDSVITNTALKITFSTSIVMPMVRKSQSGIIFLLLTYLTSIILFVSLYLPAFSL